MKLIFTIILAFAGAVALAKISMDDPGLVVFAWDQYTVKLPFLLFALGLVVAFILLYLSINSLVGMFRAPQRIGKWRGQRHQVSIQENTMKGYAALIEGDWARAEKALLHRVEHNESSLMSYLGAAYAAQQQGHNHHRDQCLDEALKKYPKQQLAINLPRSRLLFHNNETAQAREWLERLGRLYPRNIPSIRLLARVYGDLNDWHALVDLLGRASKVNAFSKAEYKELEVKTYDGLLHSPALFQGGVEQSAKTWQSLPHVTRRSPDAVYAYANQLIEAGESVQAERLVRQAMNRGFHSNLAYIYGNIDTSFTSDQIKLVQSWAKNHNSDPGLMLSLAKLHMRNGERPRARELLRAVIDDPLRGQEAAMLLGEMLERNGEKEAAMLCYKKALAIFEVDRLEQEKIVPPDKIEQAEAVLLEDASASNGAKEVIPAV